MTFLFSHQLLSTQKRCPQHPWAAAPPLLASSFHSTKTTRGLEEFFDDPKNWGQPNVKAGKLDWMHSHSMLGYCRQFVGLGIWHRSLGFDLGRSRAPSRTSRSWENCLRPDLKTANTLKKSCEIRCQLHYVYCCNVSSVTAYLFQTNNPSIEIRLITTKSCCIILCMQVEHGAKMSWDWRTMSRLVGSIKLGVSKIRSFRR